MVALNYFIFIIIYTHIYKYIFFSGIKVESASGANYRLIDVNFVADEISSLPIVGAAWVYRKAPLN
jgi:hypothetical protein